MAVELVAPQRGFNAVSCLANLVGGKKSPHSVNLKSPHFIGVT
jgi:hypothetical protein